MSENSNNYLELVSEQSILDGTLTNEDIVNIQIKLWKLLGKRTECFTMGDSSSVPVEIAEGLMKSISFTLSLYMKNTGKTPAFLLETADMQELLKVSWREIELQMKTGRELLQKVKDSAPPVENISYKDTLKGIGVFFKKYDYRFFAHEIPCDIDYQLCHPLPDNLQGIEYINGYLNRLWTENRFCEHFNAERMVLLLKSYCPDYKGLLINLFEPVAVNAIGLALIGGDIFALDIGNNDRSTLLGYFKSWTKIEAMEALRLSADKLYHTLQLEDISICEYLQRTASELYYRIEAALPAECLEGIFLSLYFEQAEESSPVRFIDGNMMDNEDLRKLIDEIRDCRYSSDKIVLVRQEVHSVRDLTEVLNIGFWGDECTALFDTFDDLEIELLLQFIQNQPSEWHSDSGWENQLMQWDRGN